MLLWITVCVFALICVRAGLLHVYQVFALCSRCFALWALSCHVYPPISISRLRISGISLLTKHIEGVTHIIEKLPEGYCLFDRPRGTNPLVVSVPELDNLVLANGLVKA
jgi:hypothetical protein